MSTPSDLNMVAALVAGATDHTVQTAAALRETLERIGRVTGALGMISAQTRLLALNASIEASRAGVEGRGFGVVATEMKLLASQVEQGTEEIERCVREAFTASDHSREAIETLHAAVAQGLAVVERMALDDVDRSDGSPAG